MDILRNGRKLVWALQGVNQFPPFLYTTGGGPPPPSDSLPQVHVHVYTYAYIYIYIYINSADPRRVEDN